MSATWGTFQSAIQLAAGANLALYAFPQLAQRDIEMAHHRWQSLINDLRHLKPDLVVAAETGYVAFRKGVHRFEAIGGWIRRFALWVAALSAMALLKASLDSNAGVDGFLWLVLLIGVAPSVGLIVTNVWASVDLAGSLRERLQLQAQASG